MTAPKELFFSFDGESHDTHETAEEAHDACDRALDDYRADAGEGWCEYVERIAWGSITEHVVESMRVEHLPGCVTESGFRYECADGCEVGGDWPGRVDYGLVPVTGEVAWAESAAQCEVRNSGTPKDKGETYVIRGSGRKVATMRWRPDLDRWHVCWSHGGEEVWSGVPSGFRWRTLASVEWLEVTP